MEGGWFHHGSFNVFITARSRGLLCILVCLLFYRCCSVVCLLGGLGLKILCAWIPLPRIKLHMGKNEGIAYPYCTVLYCTVLYSQYCPSFFSGAFCVRWFVGDFWQVSNYEVPFFSDECSSPQKTKPISIK